MGMTLLDITAALLGTQHYWLDLGQLDQPMISECADAVAHCSLRGAS